MITPLGKFNHPFLGSQQLHTITIGSPALYPDTEPRRLGYCESSRGAHRGCTPSLSLKRSFLVNSVFFQDVPYDFTQTSGQGDGRRVWPFMPFVVLKVNTTIRRGANRTPGCFHQSPSQPFIAHGKQSPMKDFTPQRHRSKEPIPHRTRASKD